MSMDESAYAAPQRALDRSVEAGARSLEDAIEGNWDFDIMDVMSEAWQKISGAKGAMWVGILVVYAAVATLFEGFNRWLLEDWGFNHRDRIFSAPYITLADPARAERELEWVLGHDARVFVMRPAAIMTREGSRPPGDPVFDGFWSRGERHGRGVTHTPGGERQSTARWSSREHYAVLGVPCDTNGLAAWAAGRSKHEYTRSTAGDKAAALSPAAEAALEAYLEARDCATLSEWDAAHPPRLLHASALLEACAKRGHVTTAAAESLRHSFVRDHCRG